jgi:hypothetical protein
MLQIRRSFSSIIARAGLATAAMAAGGVATAADISWSVGIASPGYQVVVTQVPPVVVHHPVVVLQQPVVVVQPPPHRRIHRPVVVRQVVRPQVVYTRGSVLDHRHGRRVVLQVHGAGMRDAGHQHKEYDKHRKMRPTRHALSPGYDGNWGNN